MLDESVGAGVIEETRLCSRKQDRPDGGEENAHTHTHTHTHTHRHTGTQAQTRAAQLTYTHACAYTRVQLLSHHE